MPVGRVRSGRVVPRLRRAQGVNPAGVPAELLRRDDPLWGDPVASEAWFRAHGLEPGPHFDAGPASRRKNAVQAWALANGCTRDDLPRLVDHHKVAEVGIPAESDGAAMRERWRRLAR